MLVSKFSLLSFLAPFYLAKAENLRNQHPSSRRLTFDSCTVLKTIYEFENEKESDSDLVCSCETDDGTIAELTNLDAKVCEGMKSGESVLSSSSGFNFDVATQKASIPFGAQLEEINEIQNSERSRRHRRRLTSTGDKSTLVIRADAPDASTTNTVNELREEVFGVGGNDPVNLSSQYSACSYGQLTFYPNPNYGNNGVHSTTITTRVRNEDDGVIRNAMRDQAAIDFGIDDVKDTGDHVILCIPPGTSGGWIAYAYVNHWLSVYNDRWCTYPTGLLHEVGHNLGLPHSGSGSSEYGDVSGIMGASYASDDGPLMCFNGAKTYQLGWFPTYSVDVTSDSSFNWSGDLIGFVDRDQSQSGDVMIFRFIPKQGDEYYMHFNRQASFNAGTNKSKDKIMIVTRPPGLDYEKSWFVEALEDGDDFEIRNFGDQGTLTITVGSITLNDNGKSPAQVTIQYGSGGPTPTSPPIPLPTPAPVTQPVPAPVTQPTPSPVTATQPPVPPTACTECDDVETPFMENRGQDCTTSNLINTRCNKNNNWSNNGYCRLSCFIAGNGYDGDNCCVGSPTNPPIPSPTNPPTPSPTNPPIPSPTNAPIPSPTNPPNSNCIQCTNNPTNGMTKRGKTCENFNISNKCNKKNNWIRNKFCQHSCYLEGLGYEGDVCC